MSTQRKVCDLSATLKRLGGNVGLLYQLVDLLHEDLPSYLTRLHLAVAEGDAAQVHLNAHCIKGLVLNFDAEAAAEVAMRLCSLGRRGELDAAPEILRELDIEIGRLNSALRAELVAVQGRAPHSPIPDED